MKFFNKHNTEKKAEEKKVEKKLTERVRQYVRNMFTSKKCKNMSHGSFCTMRSISWAHKDEWRRNHPKSK